jgi:uncharacterized protein (DUF1501 family)
MTHCSSCNQSRRAFLRTGLFGLGLGMRLPWVFEHTSLAMASDAFWEGRETHPDRIMVIVELAGGNDGLNTVVPYRQDAYYQLRPTLAIKAQNTLKLTDDVGLHPAMTGFKALWDAGQLAIIPGCGYPQPTRSHFTAMAYWHTAVPHGVEVNGWAGRFADAAWPQGAPNQIVNIAARQSLAVQAQRHAPVVFSDPERFIRAGDPSQEAVYRTLLARPSEQTNKTLAFVKDMARTATDSAATVREAIKRYETPVSYGVASAVATLATDLRKVAALIHARFPTRIYYVSLSGFDTHANQSGTQPQLLMYVADALEGFLKDLTRLGRASQVAVMVFTEFGRRVAQNQSQGTDHGAATPMYIVGAPVKGGLYGQYPSLEQLDDNGDLIMTTDFRRVYATMIKEWMGFENTETLLKGDFPTLGVFS